MRYLGPTGWLFGATDGRRGRGEAAAVRLVVVEGRVVINIEVVGPITYAHGAMVGC